MHSPVINSAKKAMKNVSVSYIFRGIYLNQATEQKEIYGYMEHRLCVLTRNCDPATVTALPDARASIASDSPPFLAAPPPCYPLNPAASAPVILSFVS